MDTSQKMLVYSVLFVHVDPVIIIQPPTICGFLCDISFFYYPLLFSSVEKHAAKIQIISDITKFFDHKLHESARFLSYTVCMRCISRLLFSTDFTDSKDCVPFFLYGLQGL